MSEQNLNNLWTEIKTYFSLQIDYTRLTATEKLATILSMVALVGIALVLAVCAIFYLSFALVHYLSEVVGSMWGAHLIVAGIFILLLILLFVFRKPLVINPVARFITKVLIDPK